MKNFVLFIMIGLVIGCKADKEPANSQPNIIFIFADDLTYTAVNALGNKEIQTPNLNRLFKRGTTFTHAYNMGGWNGAICVASRAMIISGRSLWDANEFRQNWIENKQIERTWGRLMQNAGYETYITGKWHVDAPAGSVFQNVKHIRPGMPPDAWNNAEMAEKFKDMGNFSRILGAKLPIGYGRPMNENDTAWDPTDPRFGGFWEGGKHWSEVLKDDVLGFIEEARDSNKPFFMYLAFNAPHDPRQAPKEYLDKYPLEQIGLPDNWLPEYPFKDAIGNSPDLRDEALAPFPRTEYATKKQIQEYYAIITHLDEQIGEILDGLEASGKKDDTYIIFTADHGLAVGRHGLMGKQTLFDHSIRVPFVILGPEVPEGKQITADIYLQDAMATSLELAGIKKPDYVFFNSLLPFLNAERDKSYYNAIYGGYIDKQRMIRKDGFKLIVYPELHKTLLFDLKNDPGEMNDLSENESYKEKIAVLYNELLALQKEMHDPLDIRSVADDVD